MPMAFTFLGLGFFGLSPAAAGVLRPVLALLFTTSLLFFLILRFFGQPKPYRARGACLPPGPTPWPIVGNLLTMLRHKPHFRWVLGLAEGKDITCIRLGSVHVIVVNSPELGREFLKKHDAVFASRPLTMATEYSGRGFLSVVISPWGEQWKKMRRVVASEVINYKRLSWQSKLRLEEADHITKLIYNLCKSGIAIDIRRAVRYYSGNVIRRMIFGARHFGEGSHEHGGPGEEEVEHVEAAFTVLSLIYAFCASDFLPSLRWLDVDGHEKIMKKAVGVMNKYHDPIIDERLQKWRKGEEDCSGEMKIRDVEDLLDVFISLGDDDGNFLLSPEEIKAQSAVRF